MVEKLIYSVAEAADFLNALGFPRVTGRTLARLAAEGSGPAFSRISNRRFYKPEALREYAERTLNNTHSSITQERAARKAAPSRKRKVAPAQPASRPAPRKRGA